MPPSAGVLVGEERADVSRAATPHQDAAATVAFLQYWNLLKPRLTKSLLDLFQQLTGLRLHPWWHEPGPELPPSALLKLCRQARQRWSPRLLRTCEECRRKRWPQQWS